MIEGYLARLRTELAGTDPAVAQDALYDAEEYLRAELTDVPAEEQADALARIETTYGTPAEVAAAYRDAELRPTPVAHVATTVTPPQRSLLQRFFGVVADPRAWGSVIYLLLTLATGVVYFTVVVTGLSLSLGLAILIIGIPMMLLFLAVVRALSLAEGRLVEAMLGERMPKRPRLSPSENGLFRRIGWWLKDYRTWTSMLYMLLMLPLGTIYFSLTVTAFSMIVALFALPFAQAVQGYVFIVDGYGYGMEPWALLPLGWAGGALLFVVTMHAARLVGRVHAAYAKLMLVGRFTEAA